MRELVEKKLKEYISLLENIETEKLDDVDIIKDLGMDSLEIVDVICYIEQEFNIQVKSIGDSPYTIKNIAANICNDI